MSTNIYDKFLTCACYTMLFSYEKSDKNNSCSGYISDYCTSAYWVWNLDGNSELYCGKYGSVTNPQYGVLISEINQKSDEYEGDTFYRNCTCYETCYTCNMAFYGTSSKYTINDVTEQCICNQLCYQQERTCSCNATCHLEERECGCYQARHGCHGNEGCTCNESCDGYSACNCDGGKYEDLCRQCHVATYDINSSTYNCPCDIECYSYTKPGCNCDAVNHAINYPKLCNIYTVEEECGQLYSNNVNFNYIASRYY